MLILLGGVNWKSDDPKEWAEPKASHPAPCSAWHPVPGRQSPQELSAGSRAQSWQSPLRDGCGQPRVLPGLGSSA